MDWRQYIHSDQKILLGKPTVKGTRLSVEFILGLFANGWTVQQILDNYPTLTPQAVQAVFVFVAECIRDESLYMLLEGYFTVFERTQLRQRPLP